MNNVLWGAVCASDYSIPFSYEEAHPAYTEGYYTYHPYKGGVNPHEPGTDSEAEWDDGYMQAFHNYMTKDD